MRRLYNPKGTKLPLPRVVELNRRLVQGYAKYQNDPRIIELKKEVMSYNQQLLALRVRDHQVQYAKKGILEIFVIFWYRLLKLAILSIFVLPGTCLFGLVFIACKVYSIKKAREALAASNVKVQARDVMATWKLLVALAVAPTVYTGYVFLVTLWYYLNYCNGYLPPGIQKRWLILTQAIVYPSATYAALRFGEVAMDILKSLFPLVKMMSPWSGNQLVKLQARRENLAHRITDIINTLGPEMFDDFYSKRIIQDPFTHSPPRTPTTKTAEDARKEGPQPIETYDFPASPTSPEREAYRHLPKNESFQDLTNQDIFSTRPPTPKRNHSRSPSGMLGGFQLKPFSTIDGNLEEVSKRIKSGMRSRMRRRSSTDGWEEGSGASTPGTPRSEVSEGLTMTKKEK